MCTDAFACIRESVLLARRGTVPKSQINEEYPLEIAFQNYSCTVPRFLFDDFSDIAQNALHLFLYTITQKIELIVLCYIDERSELIN